MRMRSGPVARLRAPLAGRAVAAVLALCLAVPAGPAAAAEPSAAEVLSAVVGIRAEIPANARTAESLGAAREGSGVAIGEDGLVLTIGYLILEAGVVEIVPSGGAPVAAEIVAYDHETGFGLLRAAQPLDVRPIALGDSAGIETGEPVLVASRGDPPAVQRATVAGRREFAGYWESLLPDAIFTSPPHAAFSGAALIGRDGRLLGIGSLLVGDSAGGGTRQPGNMFVPVEALKAVLPALLDHGRAARPARPWLGLYAEALQGHVFVAGVAEDGPAAAADIRPGDVVLAVAGAAVEGLADFYRKVWARGGPGVEVPLTIQRSYGLVRITVTSGDRYAWLRLKPTY